MTQAVTARCTSCHPTDIVKKWKGSQRTDPQPQKNRPLASSFFIHHWIPAERGTMPSDDLITANKNGQKTKRIKPHLRQTV